MILATETTSTLSSFLTSPALLAVLVPGVLWLLGLALNALHNFVASWGATHKSVAQQALATLLGFVDTTLTAHASAVSKDVDAAKADGTITPTELKSIANAEVSRIKALAPDLLALVGKELGITGAALEAWLSSLIAAKLSPPLAVAK